MATAFDESVRDELVQKSDLFQRFVSRRFLLHCLGLGKAKVLQMKDAQTSQKVFFNI